MPTSEFWTQADGDWYSMFAILVNVAGFMDGNLLKCDLATLLMGSIFKLNIAFNWCMVILDFKLAFKINLCLTLQHFVFNLDYVQPWLQEIAHLQWGLMETEALIIYNIYHYVYFIFFLTLYPLSPLGLFTWS